MKLTIRAKLLASSLFAIVVFAVLGVTYFVGARQITALEDRSDAAVQMMVQAADLRGIFMQRRTLEKQLTGPQAPAMLAASQAERQRLVAGEAGLAAAIGQLGAASEEFRAMQARRIEYDAKFEALTARIVKLGPTEKDGLQFALRDAVHKVETVLNGEKNDTLLASMLMLRRHEKDFMLRLRADYVERLDKTAAEFAQKLESASLPADKRVAIAGLLDTYRRTFAEYAAGRLAVQQAEAELDAAADGLWDSYNSLVQKAYHTTEASSVDLHAVTARSTMIIGSVILLGAALMLAVSLLVGREIVSAIQSLGSMLQAFAEDRFVENERLRGRDDEIGAMAKHAFLLRDKVLIGLQARNALQAVTTGVMLADADHKIVYLNRTAENLFSSAEAALRRDLPDFRKDGLVGSNIDLFRGNPALQAQALDLMTQTMQTRLEIGGYNFDLIVTPVFDGDGNRIGTAVEWTDVTQILRVQGEISEIVQAAQRGRLDDRIQVDGKKGFMLEIAGGMNGLLDTVSTAMTEMEGVIQGLAAGNLDRRVTGQYDGMFGRIKDNINTMTDRLRDFAQRLSDSAETVNNASAEISSGSQNLASRTESQAASIEETAASMHEITTTVKQNADNAQAASQLAVAARDTAEKGGSVVSDAVAAVTQIEESAQKISDIVGLIDEIAFQTNLLALNASVEAARAGEAGKGFAVVAQEVRALAQRSANASKDIKALITESNTQVKTGAALVNQAGQSLTEIVSGVKKVADIVAEIAAASREQATGLDQINTAVGSMDEMTQRNGALVEETSAAAQALSGQAGELARVVGFFKLSASAPRARGSLA
ncbi:methyl-accepting chemotaxis protein [Ferrovibrio sp.]|uniref:methyl-accepting chemotaxis protein n=1 Tax=Ferrovibrio sp. TaxID=1917215 RepID=UPI00311E014F